MIEQIRLHPRHGTTYVSRNRTVLATDPFGVIQGAADHGLYVHQTRLLSRWRYLIDGHAPDPVVSSNVTQHSWLGYFISFPPGRPAGPGDVGSGHVREAAQHTIELRVSRTVGDGLHEDLDLVNHTQEPAAFRLDVEWDADFADYEEVVDGRRRQRGRLRSRWQPLEHETGELRVEYRVRHEPAHDGARRPITIHRGFVLRVAAAAAPRHRRRRLSFDVELAPHGTWHACLRLTPVMEGTALPAPAACRAFGGAGDPYIEAQQIFRRESTRVRGVRLDGDLTPLVERTVARAGEDLVALRLYDLDHGDRAWTVAAGVPMYVALFGRDTQAAAWQSGLLSPMLLAGTLEELVRWQGREENPWRDEQPGRMLHEAHTGPLAVLNITPRARYYGSVNTSTFYPLAVAELWHWTGDKDLIAPLLQPARDAVAWCDRYCDLDGDGFFEYQTHSPMGTRHQAWKDSADAVVNDDGSDVEPPIATCEEQGFVYVAWLHFAEVLAWLGERNEAAALAGKAEDLRRRFNEAFWMPDRGFYAFGLDSRKRQIRSIASNAGHCLAAGIVDRGRAELVASRLLQPDLFSGWGVRTLSSDHPAYNPFSYHRGSVWPVEQGTFTLGFMRYGLHEPMQRLAQAFFESAGLFELNRLPEVYAGHPRDEIHPFPAIYPAANWPQAWSASAVYVVLQSLLGLYPYAPLATLFVDPHLPVWLPDITIENLRVGGASIAIRFFRREDGSSDYRIIDTRGDLRVLRQPSPWSVSATTGERLRDLVESLLPGR